MTTSSVCPILVGRENELAFLSSGLDEGGVILVAGEAGIGKSRLIREFASRAQSKGHGVVWGRPEAVGRQGPYSLLLDLLEGIATGSDVPISEEAEEMANALAFPSTREDPPARQIAARTRGLIAGLGKRPVLLFEDLHQADEPSQAVIAHLARAAQDDGTLLIGSLRSEEVVSPGTARFLDVLTKDRLASRLNLEPLDQDQVRAMLEAMWDEAPTPEDMERIQERGEGIPYFVEELAAARDSSRAIPASVATAVETRLSRVGSEFRSVLLAAALAPGALDPGVLAKALGIDEPVVPPAIVAGVGVGLLADEEGRIVFRHRLLREAVGETLLSVERKALHRQLAEAILSIHATETGRYALTLAHHFEEADDHRAAAEWLTAAGDRALAAGSLDDADKAYTSAIDLCPQDSSLQAQSLRGRAEVAARRNALDSAAELFRLSTRAFLAVDDQAGAAAALMEEARIRSALGDSAALELVERAIGFAGEDEELLARALYRKGLVAAALRPVTAIPILEAAMKAARSCSSVELAIHCAVDLTRHYTIEGDVSKATELGDWARKAVIEHGFDHLVSKVGAGEAARLSFLGRNAEAIERLDEATSLLVEGLSSHHLPGLNLARALTLWRMGRPDDAQRFAKRMEIGRASMGYGRVISVWAALEKGEEDWARLFLDSWWESVGSGLRDMPTDDLRHAPESPEGGQYAQMADSILAAFADRPSDQDEDRARRYWELCQDGFREVQVQAGCLLGLTLVHRGRFDGARTVLLAIRTAPVGATYQGLVWEIAGGIDVALDDREAAAGAYREALRALESIDNSSDRARVLLQLAALLSGEESIELLREAFRIASEVGASRHAHAAERELRARGIRPRAGRPKGSGRKEGLSTREEEVVTLVASGATNAEIAARLFLSERTIQDHITRAGKRLGVSGRAGLAAWAAKKGLI